METRIRIVWILTIISALAVTGMQLYWLYTQYLYSLENYTQELLQQVTTAGEEAFHQRKEAAQKDNNYNTNWNWEIRTHPQDSSEVRQDTLIWQIGVRYTPKKSLLSALTDTTTHIDTLHIRTNVPQHYIYDATDLYRINRTNPFLKESLDSLLRQSLTDISFTTRYVTECDTFLWEPISRHKGNLLHQRLSIYYPYNPLEKQIVEVDMQLPYHPILKEMSLQLAGSFCLILLLSFCLLFQIKTILKQRKIDELRRSFLCTMIHELKRPVQTLKTFVSFLSDKQLRTDESATDGIIQDSMFELDNLTAYLNKLKDMTRLDTEETTLRISLFNIKELIEKVIRLTVLPTDKEVRFETVFELSSPIVQADPVHFANVISNLVENAVKYSGARVLIRITCRMEGRWLSVNVADDGIGIPLAEQQRVFSKFYRGSNLPDSNLPGLGLGLSYVKLITEAHHGTVFLNSRPGKGTSVTLNLPQ